MSTSVHPPAAPVPGREPALPRRSTGWVSVLVLLLVLAAAVLVRQLLVGPVAITSTSMSPTLRPGDVVLVDQRAPAPADLARGDLVRFRHPATGEELVKRVMGLPGERVAILDAVLHVDGEPVPEPFVDDPDWEGIFTAEVLVPADAVYVLGDNRLGSVDSRDFGPVPAQLLDGRVLARIWPPVR